MRDDLVARGDSAANAARWQDAVRDWTEALDGQQRAEAEERLHWFLDEAGHFEHTERGDFAVRRRARRWLIATIVAGTAGVLITLSNLENTGIDAGIRSGLAWTFYIAAMACAALYAASIGHRTRRSSIAPEQIARAKTLSADLRFHHRPRTSTDR